MLKNQVRKSDAAPRDMFIRDVHLGDIVVFLNLLYSHHIESGQTFTVYGPDYTQILLELFDYQGITYGGKTRRDIGASKSVSNLMPHVESGLLANNRASVYFLTFPMFHYEGHMGRLSRVYLPESRTPLEEKKDLLCFQFDSRSTHEHKHPLKAADSELVLNQFALPEDEIVGIGGFETRPYLDKYEFRLGSLRHITRNLKSCRLFVGADSGMSHLCGTIGTPGEVMIIHSVPHHSQELIKFYGLMYPSIRCHPRYRGEIRMI